MLCDVKSPKSFFEMLCAGDAGLANSSLQPPPKLEQSLQVLCREIIWSHGLSQCQRMLRNVISPKEFEQNICRPSPPWRPDFPLYGSLKKKDNFSGCENFVVFLVKNSFTFCQIGPIYMILPCSNKLQIPFQWQNILIESFRSGIFNQNPSFHPHLPNN